MSFICPHNPVDVLVENLPQIWIHDAAPDSSFHLMEEKHNFEILFIHDNC